MEYFIEYLDQIKAEQELKEKTKIFLRKALAEKQKEKEIKNDKERLKMNKIKNFQIKRIILTACSIFAVILLAVGGYSYYKNPINYVSLDINPSVEIGLNAFNKVVSVEATNEDGKKLIINTKIQNQSVENAINLLVQEAVNQGFINNDGSTVIAVTAQSDNEEKALALKEKSSNGVNLAMSAKNSFATVYKDCSDLALRNEAKEMGISPGKYKLIKMLQTLDPSISIEQYKNEKVNEIMKKANELIKNINNNNQSDEVKQTIARVKATIEEQNKNEIKAAEKEKNQENSSNSNGNQNQEREENKNNSESSQNQEQEENQNGTSSQNQGSTSSAQQGNNTSQGQSTSSAQQGNNTSQGQSTSSSQQGNNTSQGQSTNSSQQGNNTSQGQSTSSSQQGNNTSQQQGTGK